MAFDKLQDRLHKKLGEATFLQAQRDLLTPPRTLSFRLVLCHVIAAAVLVLPFGVGLCGLALIIWTFPAFLGIAIGCILLGVAYVLLPRMPQNTEVTLTCAEMPELFRLLSAISNQLGAKVPDGVHLLSEPNAYAVEYGWRYRQQVLGLGLPLWAGLSDQEKIGLIAHEMAHFVNGDPARGKMLHLALQTVDAWDYFLAPDPYVMGRDLTEMLSDLVQNVLRAPVLFAGFLLTALHFRDSQQAEYLADGYAARVSGTDAFSGVLRKLMLCDLMNKAVLSLYPYSKDQNRRIFDVLGAAIADPDPSDAEPLWAKMEQQKLRADATHPPSVYRIAFVDIIDAENPTVLSTEFDFDQIDREMHAEADRLGERLMQSLEPQ